MIVLKTFVSLQINLNLITFDMYPKITIVTLNSTMVFRNSFMANLTWVFDRYNIIRITRQ